VNRGAVRLRYSQAPEHFASDGRGVEGISVSERSGDRAASQWGGPREMGELEATMWRAGRHPQNSTQGAVMEVFSGTPEWATVRQLHIDGLARYPRFMQRVVEPALPIGPPVWVDDADFDLDYHLQRTQLSGPGSSRQLLDLAQQLGGIPLDPHRPPWVATFIEGLEGGRSAYVLTVHHCLMDGHGSVQLLGDLHGTSQSDWQRPRAGDRGGESRPTDPVQLAADHALAQLRGLPKATGRLAAGVVAALRIGPLDSLRYIASVSRVLAPPPAGDSEILKGGSRARWRYEILNCSLAELKAAGKAAGGTINDAYVAAVIGGLRIYHEKRGADIGDITINMPVSLRRPGDHQGGNRFVTAFIKAPSSISDPAERIARLRRRVDEIGGEPALDFFGALLPVINRAPSAVLTPLFNSLQDRTDLTISNVPGMTSAVKFAGSVVEGIYYFGPLPGCHITTVLFSYNGNCYIGINCDEEVFGKTDELVTSLGEGLREVLDLRHIHEGA
jgi:diacylglycerol O-acyltransferase / wax synthase